jgi:hypothetical protein
MWKIFLALISHRFLLVAVALFTINVRISPRDTGRAIRPLQPKNILISKFLERIEEGPEVRALTALNTQPAGQVFQLSQDPFLWLARIVSLLLGNKAIYSVLILSNIFLLLFLWELNNLASRMALPEVASGAGILTVLWMTSYELSLGSNLSLTCFLVMLIFRTAIDSQWVVTGAGLALLAFTDRLALGLLPLLLFLFWHFQRFDPAVQVLKKGFLLLLPVILAVILRWKYYQDIWLYVEGSALSQLVVAVKKGTLAGWPLSQAFMGQTIALIVFFAGAIAAAVVNSSLILRILPLLILILVTAFSSYSTLASRLLIAAVCFEGITATVSGLFIRLIQLALIILSCYEMVSLF